MTGTAAPLDEIEPSSVGVAAWPPLRSDRILRYSLIALILCLVVCGASMAGLNKTRGFTAPNHVLGWMVGFSALGVLVSLVLVSVRATTPGNDRQMVWALVPMLTLSFLAFLPFLVLASSRRRGRDWAAFAGYLTAVTAQIALVVVARQGSTDWSISYAMIPLVAGTAALHAYAAFSPASMH